MKNLLMKFLILFGAISIVLLCIALCFSDPIARFWRTPQVTSIMIADEYYWIDPDTILQSLAQGKKDIFTRHIPTQDVYSLPIGMAVRWKSEDYLHVAQALHEAVTNDPMENWSLRNVDYELTCSETADGMQYAQFEFYKDSKSVDDDSRLIDRIYISPKSGMVEAYVTTVTPNWEKFAKIKLSQLSVNAEKAVQIAEQNGGLEARMKVNNECKIYAMLGDNWWLVFYELATSSNDYDVLLKLNIDPMTGKFEKVYPKPEKR